MLPGVPGVLSFLRMNMDCFRMELRNIKGKKKNPPLSFYIYFSLKLTMNPHALIYVLLLGRQDFYHFYLLFLHV